MIYIEIETMLYQLKKNFRVKADFKKKRTKILYNTPCAMDETKMDPS